MSFYVMLIAALGMLLILVAFFLEDMGKFSKKKDIRYNILNLFGAAMLLYYAITLRGWIFIALNSIWIIVAAAGILKKIKT